MMRTRPVTVTFDGPEPEPPPDARSPGSARVRLVLAGTIGLALVAGAAHTGAAPVSREPAAVGQAAPCPSPTALARPPRGADQPTRRELERGAVLTPDGTWRPAVADS